jgi:multicomponent Na+:H+ antiporter subunit A
MVSSHGAAVLLVPLCALSFGALAELLFARILTARAKGVLATVCAVPACAAALWLVTIVHTGAALDIALAPWDGPLRIVLHADALSALFAGMGTLLGAIVLLYSVGYMERDRAATRFYATMLLFIAGFVALVYCANLFLLYFCWEIIGLCSFSLVGFWFQQKDAVAGARKVLLMTHLAGYGLLIAVLVLYHRTGSALWTDPSVARNFSIGVFLLMLIAVVGKSVQVPLHTWIPDAMAAPTPVSSLLHAACYVTAGVYLAARMHSFAVWPAAWSAIVVTIATITILVGVMYAVVQRDLKRMLAYSTISQIGYMLLGIGIGTPLGITAGLLHCLNHGFFKGGLFLNAGAVQHACGTRDMDQLGGLADRMPRTALCWLVGVGNMAGIPLMSGFVSKWMIYAAALEAGWAIPAVIAWIASLGTVFICAKATSVVFFGPPTERTRNAFEANFTMRAGMELLALGSIVLGIAPQLAVIPVLQPMLAAFGMDASLRVTWLGFFTGAGSFSTTGGLVLAVLSFVAGGGILALARLSHAHVPAHGAAGSGALAGSGIGAFTGGEPLWNDDRLSAGDFSLIFEQNWRTFFRWTNVDRVYALLLHQLRASSRLVAAPVRWLEKHALVSLLVLSATAFVCIRFAAPASALAESFPSPALPGLLVAAVCIAALALTAAASEVSPEIALPVQIALISALAISGMMANSESARLALLESATGLSLLPVWRCARTLAARFSYLSVVGISVFCFAGCWMLNGPGTRDWARTLLLVGVCVKFAMLPFFFWMLRLADELPSPLLGLMIAVIDISTVAEISSRAQGEPSLLAPAWLWLVLATVTSLAAGLLMLCERSLKRLLVLSSIEDFGFVLLGISCLSTVGRDGVIFAATSHALAKGLLFVCISTPERDHALHVTDSGLAHAYPCSAFGFLIGMLAMIGVPPLAGYPGRWRLYEAALQMHPALLACFIAASAMSLIAYISVFATRWWGDSSNQRLHQHQRLHDPPHRSEPWLIRASIVVLAAALLTAGLWPQAIFDTLQGGRP